MEKLNVHSFYFQGADVRRCVDSFERNEPWGHLRSLFKLKEVFEVFLERSAGTSWKSSRGRARDVLNVLGEFLREGITPSPPNAVFPEGYLARVADAVETFEATFASESMDANVFTVSQKGTHASLDLMERAEDNLPPDVKARLSPETVRDIRDAGKCLVLDCHTASGYHILRAVERLVIKYYEKVSGVPVNPRNRNWGVHIRELKRLNILRIFTETQSYILKTR
jgi:hypothetical protein